MNSSSNLITRVTSSNIKEDSDVVVALDKKEFRILVLDDAPTITDILIHILEKEGYTCQACLSPSEAVELLEQDCFDFVITDMRMPEMSGLDFADVVASKNGQIQIAFMSGFKDFTALTKAIDFEPVGFVTKPFEQRQILELADRAFAHFSSHNFEEEIREKLECAIETSSRELEFRTERLAVEKTLIHGIIDNASFGMIATDSDGSIHLINSLATKTLGVDLSGNQSLVGLSLLNILSGKLEDIFDTLMKGVLQTKTLQEADCINGPNDTMLNIITYPVCYSKEISAIVFVIQDITEKNILQKQLLQTAKLASIGELAAGVAHEINNPLGFVMSNCNTLVEYLNAYKEYIKAMESQFTSMQGDCKKCPKQQKTKELKEELDIEYISEDTTSLLEETQSGLKRMSKIVADLKTFAHSDRVSPEKAQVNKLIEDSLNLVKNQTKYNLEIVKKFADLPEITCFPNQLVQVFTNLFVNASHAVSDKGTLTITTSASEINVSISIQDTGKGISDKDISKIFDPFFTTKEPGKGTGMGLSISHGIIEKHNGTIIATSEVGVGTEFVIVLPIKGGVKHESDTDSAGTNP